MKAWCAVLALLCCCGCSLLGARGPPPAHEKLTAFDCTDNRALPTLDSLAGLAARLGALLVMADAWKGDINAQNLIIGLGFTWAISFTSSMYGYSVVKDCREAKEALDQRMSQPPQEVPIPLL